MHPDGQPLPVQLLRKRSRLENAEAGLARGFATEERTAHSVMTQQRGLVVQALKEEGKEKGRAKVSPLPGPKALQA